MDAILAFDIKKCITINGILPCNVKEHINFFYNKTKCNVVIMIKNNYLSNYNNLKAPNEDILILYFKNGIIETYRKLG
jgi:hypothetical protein